MKSRFHIWSINCWSGTQMDRAKAWVCSGDSCQNRVNDLYWIESRIQSDKPSLQALLFLVLGWPAAILNFEFRAQLFWARRLPVHAQSVQALDWLTWISMPKRKPWAKKWYYCWCAPPLVRDFSAWNIMTFLGICRQQIWRCSIFIMASDFRLENHVF